MHEQNEMAANLKILGVYWLDVTSEVFTAQVPMHGDEALCRDHFSSVVLIEAVVDDPDERFSVDHFTQPNPAYPRGASQVAWDEALLSTDGETLLARSMGCVKGKGPLRFAFYMHYWDVQLPLRWSYGEIICPAPQTMPARLEMLVPYRPRE